MSRISIITSLIDNLISDNYSASTTTAHGICTQDQREGQTLAVKYIGNGDYKDIGIDDSDALMFYHRVISDDEVRDSQQGFGNNLQVIQTLGMRLVVYCNARNFKSENEDLSYALRDDITSLIPSSLTSTQVTLLNAQSCFINISGKEIDKRKVFNEEFDGAEFNVPPSDALFYINYSVRLTYLENCKTLTLCN